MSTQVASGTSICVHVVCVDRMLPVQQGIAMILLKAYPRHTPGFSTNTDGAFPRPLSTTHAGARLLAALPPPAHFISKSRSHNVSICTVPSRPNSPLSIHPSRRASR
ncbi:hypothetical protein EVG20_g9725 [Dentipellis fragilis]|uniref:Uncharacterized protein n=1 Tax=Dentipellis fragilis TaxID=205917 RepID=A0A4Y9XVU1_9AGAM|nr:hypothetical protein EVG20_g9725 [Dentipellis fragilis]